MLTRTTKASFEITSRTYQFVFGQCNLVLLVQIDDRSLSSGC